MQAARILLCSDLHANLPAAEAAVRLARRLGVDSHWHLGDALDIGPWPRETLDLLSAEGVRLIKGNHEEFATSQGIGPTSRSHMKQALLDHIAWTRSQLEPDHLARLESLPHRVSLELCGFRILLQHYLLQSGRVSETWHDLEGGNLAELFEAGNHDAVFFGHIHRQSEWTSGGIRFHSLASAGCSMDGRPGSGKTAVLLEAGERGITVSSHELEWDTQAVHTELLQRKVPDKELIKGWFFR